MHDNLDTDLSSPDSDPDESLDLKRFQKSPEERQMPDIDVDKNSRESLVLWAHRLELEALELRSNSDLLQQKLVNVVDDLSLMLKEAKSSLVSLNACANEFNSNSKNLSLLQKLETKINNRFNELSREVKHISGDGPRPDDLNAKLDLILSNQLKILEGFMSDTGITQNLAHLTSKSNILSTKVSAVLRYRESEINAELTTLDNSRHDDRITKVKNLQYQQPKNRKPKRAKITTKKQGIKPMVAKKFNVSPSPSIKIKPTKRYIINDDN